MIYVDNSATTRPFDSCMRENYFNASAAYKPAVDVDRAMRECRRAIAAQLGIQESGVIFTGGGTESDNLAILGVAETLRQSANFVCSAIEHPAVAETIHRVEQMGHTVRVLPIDVRGVVDLAACETVIDEHTALVSCMQVSNETGAIQPVEELAKLARRKNPNVRVHAHAYGTHGRGLVCAQRSQDSRAEGHRRAGGASGRSADSTDYGRRTGKGTAFRHVQFAGNSGTGRSG